MPKRVTIAWRPSLTLAYASINGVFFFQGENFQSNPFLHESFISYTPIIYLSQIQNIPISFPSRCLRSVQVAWRAVFHWGHPSYPWGSDSTLVVDIFCTTGSSPRTGLKQRLRVLRLEAPTPTSQMSAAAPRSL
jgi:hypothetical protein